MFLKLSILFITVPICEIFIFLEAGRSIGLWPTLATVFLTGVAGAYLAKTQGLELMLRFQAALQRNELPADELIDGIFILAGGLLLLTPGFLTDAIGFICLAPFSRKPIKNLVIRWLKQRIQKGEIIIRKS